MAPAPMNPFYAPTAPPTQTSRPAPPPRPAEPVTYGSLSDLTSGRANPPPLAPPRGPPSYNRGNNDNVRSPTGDGRRLPPFERKEQPIEPPRRNVASTSTSPTSPATTSNAVGQSYWSQATSKASGYIPNSVSATATSAGDRVKGGFDSVVNQQTKEQIMTGAASVAGSAAKLMGKATWQLGKFASGNK